MACIGAAVTPSELPMRSISLTRADLHAAYRQGLDPASVIASCHARIACVNDPGVFLHLIPEAEALAAARALPAFDPAALPLWGLPFVVKDNIDVAGLPTTAGCPDFAYVPGATAPAVERLLAAGAILLGKTNLDQFATGLVGVRTPYPAPRNPFDPLRVPGGSSSGSAVAVAQGIATFSLGTDTAGSGRIPAALNNLVGLKPSLGAISTRGVFPACRTLDCVSVFALTVDDASAVFAAAAAYDPAEPYSRQVPQAEGAIGRIGAPAAAEIDNVCDPLSAAAWRAGLEALRAAGAEIVETSFDHFREAAGMLYAGPWVAERRAAVGAFMDERPEAMHPVTRGILAGADAICAADAFRAFYRLAELKRRCEATFLECDALAVPTAPLFPLVAELAADPIGPNNRLGAYTNFVNLFDLAALAVPGPFRADGLPAGLTLIAPAGHDLRLAALGRQVFGGVGGAAGAARQAAA